MATDLENKLMVQQQRGGEVVERGRPSSVTGWLQHGTTTKQLARLLGSDEMAERWLRIALTECQRNPKLFDCTFESFAGALMQCAQIKLEPGQPLGLSWIIPFENSVRVGSEWTKRLDAQFQLGWTGIVQLARRSGQLGDIAARDVCERDEFDFNYLTGHKHHKPPLRGERGDAYGFYCYAKFANGGEHFLYMTREQVLAHAQTHSQSYKSAIRTAEKYKKKPTGPWFEHFEAMGRKTTVKLSRPFLPASPDWIAGLDADDRVVSLREDRLIIDAEDMGISLSPTVGELTDGEAESGEKTATAREEKPQGAEGTQAQQPAEGADAGQGDLLKGRQ